MEQSPLLCHLDVDARRLGVGVAHHIFDRFDVHALLDHECPEGVSQRVRGDLRMRNADPRQSLLYDSADGLALESVVAFRFVGDEQRIALGKIPVGDILLQPRNGLRMQDDDLIFVGTPLALDREDRLAFARRKVSDVDALHFAGTEPIEEHQGDHQTVAPADRRAGIDTLQQPECLIGCQRQLTVFGVSLATSDSDSDVIVIAAPFAEAVEQLEDRDKAVHGIDTLASGLQVLFVLQHMAAFRSAGVDILSAQPPEPESDLPFVVLLGRREDVALRNPFGDYLIQLESRFHSFKKDGCEVSFCLSTDCNHNPASVVIGLRHRQSFFVMVFGDVVPVPTFGCGMRGRGSEDSSDRGLRRLR